MEDFHNHGWKESTKGQLSKGFSFHPNLSKWLLEYTNIPENVEVKIQELTCGEASCPTAETLFIWFDKDSSAMNQFRISRKKEQISKMDVKLSWDRKKNLT
ncbi:MAG: hypothetical protein O9301_10635 [Leptospira sp.]|nr:hypothetical protein [Leptospira sp.]